MQGTRTDDQIKYSSILDMTAYSDTGEKLRYWLRGVMTRRGESVNAGHYVAAVRHQDGSGFLRISDHRVRDTQAGEERLNPMNWRNYPEFVLYLLIYQKIKATEEEEEEDVPVPADANASEAPEKCRALPSLLASMNDIDRLLQESIVEQLGQVEYRLAFARATEQSGRATSVELTEEAMLNQALQMSLAPLSP